MGYIDKFYEAYPEVRMYVDYCKNCVIDPGYLENPFGRRRRFTITDDEELIAAQQREAVNFTIQSSVADALNVALANFYYWRQFNPGRVEYKIVLPVHDAVFFLCKPEHVGTLVEEVIPECMTYGATIPAWAPNDGRPPRKEFTLKTDVTISLRWGEKVKRDELVALGVPERVIPV